MSAFLCSDKHIATVALHIAASYNRNGYFAQNLANFIKRVNIKSVNYRYKENDPVDIECDLNQYDRNRFTNRADIISLINCIRYQSCENENCAEWVALDALFDKFKAEFPTVRNAELWSI